MRILVEDTLIIDFERYEMSNKDKKADSAKLSKNARDLLSFLWKYKNTPLSSKRIYECVWNNSEDIVEKDQCVRDTISDIRNAINGLVDDGLAHRFLETKRNIGYLINTDRVECVELPDDDMNSKSEGSDDKGSQQRSLQAIQNFANFGSGPQIANNNGTIVLGTGNIYE